MVEMRHFGDEWTLGECQLRLTLSLEQLGPGASYYSAGSSLPDSRCPPVGGQKPAGKRGAPALQRLSGAEPGHPPLLGSSVAGLLDLGGCAKASCVAGAPDSTTKQLSTQEAHPSCDRWSAQVTPVIAS